MKYVFMNTLFLCVVCVQDFLKICRKTTTTTTTTTTSSSSSSSRPTGIISKSFRNQETRQNSHTGHYTCTSESTDVKAQKV
jgi:hypothetical protein